MEGGEKSKVLLVTCTSDEDVQFLVRGLVFSDIDGCSSEVLEKGRDTAIFSEYSWNLDNKYYTADLSLLSLKIFTPISGLANLLSDIEAIVLVFEMNDETSFQRVKVWGKFFEESDIDIKLLLAKEKQFVEAFSNMKEKVTEWCLENSFELVDSYTNEEAACDIPDKFGFERIKEALATHMWPNMVRKPEKSATEQEVEIETDIGCGSVASEEKRELQSQEDDDPLQNGTDTELQSFEEIFGKLHDMKLHAESLSDEKRKEYAEQVTIAFWKAMGQDEDEIEGL